MYWESLIRVGSHCAGRRGASMKLGIYRALVSWPGFVISNAVTILAAIASLFPDSAKSWINGTTRDQIYLWSIGGLCIVLIYWVLRLALKPTPNADIGSGGQSTAGHFSPAIGRIEGGAHFYAPNPSPAPTSPAPKPYELTDEALDGLLRVMSGAVAPAQPRFVSCPTFPIWKAVLHVARIIHDTDEANCYPASRREIRQAAFDGRIEIWGRPTIRLITLNQKPEPRDIWKAISREYWSDYKINEMAGSEQSQEHQHTDAEEHVRYEIESGRYWTLRADEREIKRAWRAPGGDGGAAPFTGPNAWMAR